jgi:hypothetical protein
MAPRQPVLVTAATRHAQYCVVPFRQDSRRFSGAARSRYPG